MLLNKGTILTIIQKKAFKNTVILYIFLAAFSLVNILASHFFRINVFSEFLQLFVKLIGYTTAFLSSITGNPFDFISEKSILSNGITTANIRSSLAFKFYFFAFLILYTAPKQVKKTTCIFVIALISLFIISVSKYLIDISNIRELKSFLNTFIYSLRYLTLYLLFVYKVSIHPLLKEYIQKADSKIKEKFQVSLNGLMLILIFSIAAMGFLDWYLIGKNTFIVEHLTKTILSISQGVFKILGYQTTLSNHLLILDTNSIYMGYPCMGIGIMSLFALLVFIIKSPVINRIIYFITGLIIILFMNSVRVTAILLFVYRNRTNPAVFQDYHNMSNNFFYFITLILIIIYVKWFQYIKFTKK